MSCFYALLEGFFWYTSQLRRYGCLDGIHAFKIGPLMIPCSLEKRKKSHRARLKEQGGCSSTVLFFSVKMTGFSAYSVMLFFWHAYIFGDNLPNTELFMSSWLATIQTVKQRLLQTTGMTCLMLTSVLLVEGFPLLASSFISSRPSLNLLCF